MKPYTVIIRPDDGDGAETVIKLQVNGATSRIIQLQLNAGPGQGLSASQLPAINLELLLAAVMPAAAPDTAPPPAALPLGHRRTRAELPAAPQPPTDQPVKAPSRNGANPDTTRGGRSPQRPATPAKKPTGKQASAAKPTASQAGADGKTRAYRTMPDDFASVYKQVKTVTGVMDAYGVPRHTVNGWLRTARRHGLVPAAAK